MLDLTSLIGICQSGDIKLFMCLYQVRLILLTYSGYFFFCMADKFFYNRYFMAGIVTHWILSTLVVFYPYLDNAIDTSLYRYVIFGLEFLLMSTLVFGQVLLYFKHQWDEYYIKGLSLPANVLGCNLYLSGGSIVFIGYFLLNFCYYIPSFDQMNKPFLLIVNGLFVVYFVVVPIQHDLLIHEANNVAELIVRYVSHEMRTPMNTIMLGLRLMTEALNASSVAKDDECYKVMKDIRLSCELALNKLNNILDHDKLEQGIYQIETEVVPASDFLINAIAPFYIQARAKDIALVGPENLNSMTNVVVNVDQNKLGQVVGNLLSNGLKFTPSGGSVRVSIDYNPDDVSLVRSGSDRPGVVVIQVTDTGPGMEQAQISQLFNSVVQFNPGRLQQGGGSGLGLYISKSITDMHGGSLYATSAGLGRGSTFLLKISASNATAPETTRSRRSTRAVAVAPAPLHPVVLQPSQKCLSRLLVADDSDLTRSMMVRVLKSRSHVVEDVVDGQEVVERVRASLAEGSDQYDLILLDFQMIRLDGPPTARAIRNLGYSGKIVGVTGNALAKDLELFRASGANHVFVKPLDLEAFDCLIEQWHSEGAFPGGGTD